jgi:hypothetical protein
LLGLLLTGCVSSSELTPSATPSPTATPIEDTATPAALCVVGDQDAYVYHAYRLQVINECLRVYGTVLAVKPEADGDEHIRVLVDAAYEGLLTAGNQAQCALNVCGLLVVEPICVGPITQADAIAPCASDHDPLGSLPTVGQHVWLEGRYVLDTGHSGWAELHPLFRWGAA